MSENQSVFYINKLAAAQRQLHAAIRMTLHGEDELAIHTLAAAAYGILRDLKRSRGRSELSDAVGIGLYLYARNVLDGIPDPVLDRDCKESPTLKSIVDYILELIRSGKVQSADDVNRFLKFSDESSYWRWFNLPANFLKHADRDPIAVLNLDMIENKRLLLGALVAYTYFFPPTPELESLYFYLCVDDADFRPGWPPEAIERFRAFSDDQRREFCLRWIREDDVLENLKGLGCTVAQLQTFLDDLDQTTGTAA